MALIVEDGTGLASANSFVSIAEADAYAAEQGLAHWGGNNRQTALIQASAQIGRTWVWPGYVRNPEQALAWPRVGPHWSTLITADGRVLTGVPLPIRRATVELAALILSGAVVSPGPEIERLRVDVLEINYATPFRAEDEALAKLDLILRGIGLRHKAGATGGNVPLERVY